ncbi:hypothetical protein [Noviherbaspirillum aerium]|uniref:hypothetical protein n=1 Tax=Noviherbaspirillum aerium TaxID=2588497 RepID=UPI00124D0ABE|nr:hypothetical protein [Noviherbaspirillum aerium]
MKTTHFIATFGTGLAVLLAQTGAHATNFVPPNATASGNVSAGTAINGKFSLGANGTSSSYAHNSQSASATVNATRAYTPSQNLTTATVSGETKTESLGKAYNVSTGSGTGSAMSSGFADTAVRGKLNIPGVTQGYNGGGSGTHTDSLIKAGTNQGSYVTGQTVSGFQAEVKYGKTYSVTPIPAPTAPTTPPSVGTTTTKSVNVAGSNEGYASGANTTAALNQMNAAGIANINSTGYFFGKTNLSGSTGYASAP